uniref:RNA-dependent RNA polymerase n=1 Tax=Picoa juniperi partitivirus 1 TaxID=2778512 RepID=A0A7L8Y986_9VIRU|nr:RNA-dependent RNA polymerase [Picoa juniperi partitivirus 1]
MLSISQIVHLYVLLKFQHFRRRNETASELIFPIRNILFEWESRRSQDRDSPLRILDYSSTLLAYIDLRTCHNIAHNIEHEKQAILDSYSQRDESFALYESIEDSDLPEDRSPAPGIQHANLRYHSIPSSAINVEDKIDNLNDLPTLTQTPLMSLPALSSEQPDLSGLPAHPDIANIINNWFPQYSVHLDTYCRPPSFGPQAFHDFNRETPDPAPPTPERHEAIMSIVRQKFNIKPFRPLHFADALAAETPLNTSASYYSKFDPETRVLARYSCPSRYKDKPTSKGYFINVMLNKFRREFHNIKYDGMPFPTDRYDHETNLELLETWFAKHPTQLFIRTQISKRDPSDPKKIRPVYAVDDRFLHIEKTLTTPLLAQMRNPQCCVAHGLETFRGSMSLLDKIALSFSCFTSLDWSQFDQRLPRYVIIAYYLDFLASLIIVSHGYMPTRNYPDTIASLPSFAQRQYNVLLFLCIWYLSLTFLSYDGFAFIRKHGGVPSGLLNTQSLDSFGNMYIITDCLLEFGFTEQDCLQMLFCVMGDDNLIFLQHNLNRVTEFMVFLEDYCTTRHGMVLSLLKCVFGNLRSKISFLSYENNYGHPTRPIGKLVAQLAFPERPVPLKREWIHAARALGLAYASCGQDPVFHLLCKMVYEKFRPSPPVPTHHIDKVFKKWKYQLPEFMIEDVEYTFPDFPTSQEIYLLVSDFQGHFSENDKWNFNVFNAPPSDNLPDYVTLKDYIQTDSEMSKTVNEIWHGKRSL